MQGICRLHEISASVEMDSISMEKYSREVSPTHLALFNAIRRLLYEQDNLSTLAIVTASNGGISGTRAKYIKRVVEHKLIHHLRAVGGRKTIKTQAMAP